MELRAKGNAVEIRPLFHEEAAFKAAKMKLSEHFTKAKRLTYKGAIFGTFIQMAGKTSVDTKKLKAEYPEVYEAVTKQGKPVGYPKFM